jgi:hypothetical protein
LTASELRDRLITILTRTHGGGRLPWRRAIGEVHVYPIDTHPHCNWTVKPGGTAREIDAVERAVDQVRDDHPFVTRG